MTKHLFVWLACPVLLPLLFLQVSATGSAQKARKTASSADVQFARGQSAARIPFERVGNFVFLQARVNNSTPIWFLLDTGATASYLDVERAKALGLGEEPSREGATLRLLGVTALQQKFLLQPMRFGIYSGHAIDGLLGYDFIRRFVVEIDYLSRTVRLLAPDDYRYSGPGEVLPLTLLEDDSGGKVPLVRVRITQKGRPPIEGKFIADTAVRSAVSFTTPFVDKNHLLQFAGKTLQAPLGGGAMMRESTQPVGRVPRIKLGRFTLTNPVAIFFRAKQGVLASTEFDGVLGAEILRRFKVIYDYPRSRLILEPNRAFAEPDSYDRSGMLLIAEGSDFKTFKVQKIIENSPAAAAGLRPGDVISAVVGVPALRLRLEQVRRMFGQKRGRVRLRIERDGHKRRAVLILKRLI